MISNDIRVLAHDGQTDLHAEIRFIRDNQSLLSKRLDNLQFFFILWFPILAVLAIVTSACVSLFLNGQKDTPKPENSSVLTYRDVQDMIDRSLRMKGD